MGLAEKRAIQDFQNNKFDSWKRQISEAAGCDLQFNIQWDTLTKDGESHLFEEGFQKVFFQPLLDAMKQICKDQMGKDAIKAGVKEIHILNKSGNYSPGRAITFQNGILTIDHEPTSNMQDIADRTKTLVSVIENGL
jgi:hypothetical protein